MEVRLPTSTVTSREFNQDSGRVKRASRQGPVLITERGKPAHVLMTYEDYERLAGIKPSLADLLSSPETADIEFLQPPSKTNSLRLPDLS
jgi:prevent-host-death family protein